MQDQVERKRGRGRPEKIYRLSDRLLGENFADLSAALLQTWLNPTPPDPVQAKMMWIMPLVFSVMFFVFPAGLVLYWLTNNLLSIAQQWFINKQLGVTQTRAKK